MGAEHFPIKSRKNPLRKDLFIVAEISTTLQVFRKDKFTLTCSKVNGEPWFLAKDIAQALDYPKATIENALHMLFKKVPEIWKGKKRFFVRSADGVEQTREMLCVTEQGLYFFLGRSDKKKAIPFQMWVAGEVLPEIRKNGCYLPAPMQEKIDALTNEVKRLMEENSMLKAKLNEGRKFRILGESIALMPGAMTIGEAAKVLAQHGLNVGQNRAFKTCREEKMLCKRKGCQKNQPTQKAIEKGYFTININIGSRATPMITPKGLQWLAGLYSADQYPLLALVDEGDNLDDSIVRKQA